MYQTASLYSHRVLLLDTELVSVLKKCLEIRLVHLLILGFAHLFQDKKQLREPESYFQKLSFNTSYHINMASDPFYGLT